MRLVLLSLCLVGLGQAGPTAPSFITDPYIRALYADIDGRITKVTWTTGGSKLSDGANTKYDIELCHNQGKIPTKVAGAVRVGLPNKGTGLISLGEAKNPNEKCCTFSFTKEDEIDIKEKSLTFVLWDVDNGAKKGFAVGSTINYYGVSKVTKGLNCNGKPDYDGFTFDNIKAAGDHGDFVILFCLDSEECIFKDKKDFSYSLDGENQSKELCIPSTKDSAEKGITQYCQTVDVADVENVDVESLNYKPYEIAFKSFPQGINDVLGMCTEKGQMESKDFTFNLQGKKVSLTAGTSYAKPTANRYTVIFNGDKIGSIQDLNVNVEKTDFNEKQLYPFSFKHLNPNPNNPKYTATMKVKETTGGDIETIVCAVTDDNDCYGFLQLENTEKPDLFTLAYAADSTNVIKIVPPSE